MTSFEDHDPPREDGFAESEVWSICPYCGVEIELLLDLGGGRVQRYVEDCEVCCRPIQLTVRWDASGIAQVEAVTDDDG